MTDTMIQAPKSSVERNDKLWLADRIAAIESGVESTAAVAQNWTQGRNLSQYFPGQTWINYVQASIRARSRSAVLPLLTGTDWSVMKIAAHTGLHQRTVGRIASEHAQGADAERPDKLLGADGKYYPARRVRTVEAEVLEAEPETTEAEPTERKPVLWTASWGRLVAAALELDKFLSGRQMSVSDLSADEWQRIDGQTNVVLRVLGTFQRREKAALAATSPGEATE